MYTIITIYSRALTQARPGLLGPGLSLAEIDEVSAGLHAFLCASRADEDGPVARLRALVPREALPSTAALNRSASL